MSPQRFLFVIHNLDYTGASLGMLEFARHLIAEGHRVDLAVSGAVRQGMEKRLDSIGIKRVGGDINAHDYAVAYVCTILSWQVASRLSDIIPVVWQINEGETGLRLLLDEPGIASAFGKVAHIIFPHAHCRDVVYRPFVDASPAYRISVISSGVDIDAAPRGVAEDKDSATILFVGSLYDRKRPFDLVRAVLEYLPEAVQCRFVGDPGGMSAEMKQAIAKAPERFTIVGEVAPEDVAEEYRRAAILCLPSSDEASPRATFEAALHECALVLSDLPVYRGLWRHGQNALMHPGSNVESLGMMLRLLIQEPDYRVKLSKSAAVMAWRHPKRPGLVAKQMVLERLAADVR